MIYILLWAYFTHTNILKATVNYLVIPIFTSGVKYGIEKAHLKKKMLIFNTIFDPAGKNWGDQIIYSHF